MKTLTVKLMMTCSNEGVDEDELTDALDRLIANALSTPGILDDFGEVDIGPLIMPTTEDDDYVKAAREEYQEEGRIEFDDRPFTSPGEEPGAYVSAWVWVYDPEGEEG
jgi:hypothetical protein